MKKRTKVLFAALVVTVIVLSVCLAGCDMFDKSARERYTVDVSGLENTPALGRIIANNCINSCAQLEVRYSGIHDTLESMSSAFFINADGYAVTNAHCVEIPAGYAKAAYTLVTVNGVGHSASVVAVNSALDIAVIKVSAVSLGTTFEYLTFTDSDAVFYGDTAYSIGNPNGIGLAITRTPVASPIVNTQGSSKPSILLDGLINHGNSGGPLLNASAKVIGVIYARIENTDNENKVNDVYGLGCAIPSNDVTDYINGLGIKYYKN